MPAFVDHLAADQVEAPRNPVALLRLAEVAARVATANNGMKSFRVGEKL